MNPVHMAATPEVRAGVAAALPEGSFAFPNATFEHGAKHRPAYPEFFAVRCALRPSGGLASGDDLARLLQNQGHGDYISLSRLIVSRMVFGFDWQRAFWVPMCQFDLRDLSLRAWPGQMLSESGDTFDGWSLAAWLVRPNARLENLRPVELLDTDLPAVLASARTDRQIAGE